VPYRSAGRAGYEVGRNVIAAQRINGLIAGGVLNGAIYYPPSHTGRTSDGDIGYQASAHSKASQAASHSPSGYTPGQLASVYLAPVSAVLA
jgi:hypothetical protein